MYSTSIEDFRVEINQIREYLKHVEYTNAVIGDAISSSQAVNVFQSLQILIDHDNSFKTDRRIFEYKAIVISLYGILEKYIEIWVKDFLTYLSTVVLSYDEISDVIRANHFDLSIKLISSITSRDFAKFQHLDKETVLKNLNQCLQNKKNFSFNSDAFILSSGNLKHVKVVELIKGINININDKLIKDIELTTYLKAYLQVANLSDLGPETLYAVINDLVDKRNKIAHGSEVVNDILSLSILIDYIDFVSEYCNAIFRSLDEEIIKIESTTRYDEVAAEKVVNVFDKSILALELENYTININDTIIVKTSENRYFKRKILELQLDSVQRRRIRVTTSLKIAIKVEPRIKVNQTFFIVKRR
ncbi:MAE_28990/MAE_18760 family HEPN-like nuclease [Fibrella aquatica]|uniref:MAE_28990/MAE_18760 family HEPN-like nuclease n=1 Tax=Fibrella aquatica TaxID=3242487 RepID=UPI003522A6DD